MSKVLLHNGDIETYRKNDHSEGNSYTLKKRQVVGSNTGHYTGNK